MASITHAIGSVFQPIFHLFGWLLAFFYGIIPNYAVAIALLTIVIMGALTPFTVKSTRSMVAMQRLQPEIKKLQQKYKGPENRQVLNEELMRLYREEGANPLGGCLPLLLQAPFLFILYSVIRGLAYVNAQGVAAPRYIPTSSTMYHNLVGANGAIKAFGMDLNLRPFPVSAHGGWVGAIPFFLFVAAAVALQYFQMAQINRRNRTTGQAVPSQQLATQRIMPIFFAYFYMVIPAAVVLYMIISTIIRIITQDIMFRTGVSRPVAEREREIPAPKAIEEEKPSPSTRGSRRESRNPNPQPSTSKPASHPRSKSKRKRKAR